MLERNEVKAVHEAVRVALEQVLSEHGFKLCGSTSTYDPASGSCRFKVETAKLTATGETAGPSLRWAANARFFGLPEGAVGMGFVWAGVQYVVADLKLRASKRPVLATRVRDGRTFQFPVSVVNMALRMAESSRGVTR